jgi:hypothetical protein
MADAFGALCAFILVASITLFAAAWATVLPTLGLLWLLGWLP